MTEGLPGNTSAMPPAKRNFALSRGPCVILFSLLLILIAGLASQAEVARSQSPEPKPAPSPPANARFVPGPSDLWTAVDYTEDGSPIVADELLVKFKDNVPEEDRDAILSEVGAQTKKIHELSGIRLVKVDPAQREQILEELSSNDNVESVGRNQIARPLTSPRKESGDYNPDSPWHLQDIQEFPSNQNMESVVRNQITQPPPPPRREPNDYDPDSLWHLENIWAPEGWFINDGSSSKYIAIVDSGVDYTHPDLAGKVIKVKDFVDDDWDPMDEFGHGTAVAGAAAAMTDNGTGIASVAWQPKILAIRVSDHEGESTLGLISQGIEQAVQVGADVINLSIAWSEHDETLYQQLLDAVDAGIIVVAGSGPPEEEHPCDMWYPANYHEVIAVSAVDRNDLYAVGCGTGQPIPSGDSKGGPDVVAPGEDVLTTALGGGYALGRGTSFASPIVAGAVAMMLSCTSDVQFVKHTIASTADDLVAPGPGFDEFTGWGRVNLYKALSEACSPAPTINVKATPNPLPSPDEPLVTIEIEASDSDSDLALVQYYIESDSGGTWSHLTPGVDPNCDSDSCHLCKLMFGSFTKPAWKYRITAAAYDEAGHRRTFCAYNCPNNDLAIDDNNWYYLQVGDGSGSSSPDQADQTVAPYLQQPAALAGSTVTVNLDWTDTEGENGFAIQKKVGTGLFADFATVPAGITDYSDTLPSSQEGKNLTYRVRARFSDDSYSLSNEKSVDAPTSYIPPDEWPGTVEVNTSCDDNDVHVWLSFAPIQESTWYHIFESYQGSSEQYVVNLLAQNFPPDHPINKDWEPREELGGIESFDTGEYYVRIIAEGPTGNVDSGQIVVPGTNCLPPPPPPPPPDPPGTGHLDASIWCGIYEEASAHTAWSRRGGYTGRYLLQYKLSSETNWIDSPIGPIYNLSAGLSLGYTFGNYDFRVVTTQDNQVWAGPITLNVYCEQSTGDLQVSYRCLGDGTPVADLSWNPYEPDPWNELIYYEIQYQRPGGNWYFGVGAGPDDTSISTEDFWYGEALVAGEIWAWQIRARMPWDFVDWDGPVYAQIPYCPVPEPPPPPPCDSFGDIDNDGSITQNDVDMITDYLAGSTFDDEELRRADVNGDSIVSQEDADKIADYLLTVVSTFPVCEDIDDDGLPNYQDEDDDNDGFTDAVEAYLGTDALDDCPNVVGSHDAWPLDIDMDRAITVSGDVLNYRGKIGCQVATNPECLRLDLNADGVISVTSDVLMYRERIGETCT